MKSRTMIRLAVSIFALLGLAIHAPAQDGSPPPKQRSVRFLAVGDYPPFRQEIRNGVRYEMPPPPGSLPPTEVVVAPEAATPVTVAGKTTKVRLQLGRSSGPLQVPSGAGAILLRAADDAAAAEPWLRVPQPASGNFLVVIWRAPKAKTWDNPKFMVVPDSHPAGKLTLLNVSPVPLAVICGRDKLLIETGKPNDRDLPGNSPIEFHIGTPTGGGQFKKMISMSLEQRPKEHTLAVMCLSDGEQPRQPIKLTLLKTPAGP